MQRWHIIAIVGLVLAAQPVLMSRAQADNPSQGPTTGPSADLYLSNSPNPFSIPSGEINVTPGQERAASAFPTDPAATGDTTNLQGCGGVGQADYTSALFKAPEVFEKFQEDVTSDLAKKILAFNFSMPQTAALFDTLNTYGNQRYLQFQQGCSLDDLRKSARQQFLNACVAEVAPLRTELVKGSGTGANAAAEEQKQAYAQAWEICTARYAEKATGTSTAGAAGAGVAEANALRKTMDEATAQAIRRVENINVAIKPLLCPLQGSNTSNSDGGCWPALLIPKVRLCHDSGLEGGCGDGKEYGVEEPDLSMARLFDLFRFVMDDVVIGRIVEKFNSEVSKNNLFIGAAAQENAASEAAFTLSGAGLNRNGNGFVTGTLISGGESFILPEASVRDFVVSHLNCKNLDMLTPLKVYREKLNQKVANAKATNNNNVGPRALAGAPQPTDIPALESPNAGIRQAVERLALTAADSNDVEALKDLTRAGLACTVNQTIPVFDPILTASLANQCLAQDRTAFYAMAQYDVALATARDAYGYLATRLKQVAARLNNETVVPGSGSANRTVELAPTALDGTGGVPGGGINNTTVINAALNQRLAKAVETIMLPAVENQLKRLNDLDQSRGVFAQRVQRIYADKRGCVY